MLARSATYKKMHQSRAWLRQPSLDARLSLENLPLVGQSLHGRSPLGKTQEGVDLKVGRAGSRQLRTDAVDRPGGKSSEESPSHGLAGRSSSH